jgi:hypothetical protein
MPEQKDCDFCEFILRFFLSSKLRVVAFKVGADSNGQARNIRIGAAVGHSKARKKLCQIIRKATPSVTVTLEIILRFFLSGKLRVRD